MRATTRMVKGDNMKEQIKIIPCLDTRGGRVVKGVKFVDIIDAGDVVECAKAYQEQGADELVFLDIDATVDGRKTLLEEVKKVTSAISIPLCVGGGIASVEQAQAILGAGASKVGISSAAILRPELLAECAQKFGSDSVVSAIDAAVNADGKTFNVYRSAGKIDTGMNVVDWAKKVESLGAGAILLTSIDKDGTKAGYDIELTRAVSQAVKIPVIASGGAGKKEHFLSAVKEGGANAVLAASLFHFGEIKVAELREYLENNL